MVRSDLSARTGGSHRGHREPAGNPGWLRACVEALGVDGASLLLHTDGEGWRTVAATDTIAAHIDQVQRTVAEGPGVEAIITGRPVQVPDWTHKNGHWPLFLAGLGHDANRVQALFALPLDIDGTTRGALHLYRSTPGAPDPGALNSAWLVAETMTPTLTTSPQH